MWIVIVGFDTLQQTCPRNAPFIHAKSASQVLQTGEPGYGEAAQFSIVESSRAWALLVDMALIE